MRKLEISQIENIQGGGACAALATGGVVVAIADVAAIAGWMAVTPWGAGVLAGASLGIAVLGLACADWG